MVIVVVLPLTQLLVEQADVIADTDVEILDMVNSTTAADATWEVAQLANVGHVYCPPGAVKAHIRQLLAH
jgi:hypothetical protein